MTASPWIRWAAQGTAVLTWGLLAAALAPAALASLPVGALALVVVVGVGAWRQNRWGRAAVMLGAGLSAYLGSLWLLPDGRLLGATLVAVVATAWFLASRRSWALIGGVAGVAAIAVTRVLERSAWAADAPLFVGLVTALGLGLLAVVSTQALRRYRISSWLMAATVALAVVSAVVRNSLGVAFSNGGWGACELTADTTLPDVDACGSLERARASGDREAAYATVALALEANADPTALRRLCPRGNAFGTAAPGFWSLLGRAVCRSTAGWPEDAAQTLVTFAACETPGAGPLCMVPTAPVAWRGWVVRLAADRLMEAGRVSEAEVLYEQAAAQGDRYAVQDHVRALLDRGRRPAREAADMGPLVRAWLNQGPADAAMWEAWNASLDFTHVVSPERSGLRTFGTPSRLASYLDPVEERRALAVIAKYVQASGFVLPLPPGGELPAALLLRFKNRRGLELTLRTDSGASLVLACYVPEPGDNRQVVTLPAAGCEGEWADALVEPRQWLSGHLTRIDIMGEYSLAYLRAVPAPEVTR